MEKKEPTPDTDKERREDEARAIWLWNTTCQLVTALHEMAQKRPELLRPIARKTFFWPGFISRKRAFDTENEKLMEKIELGVGSPYSSKKWQIEAPSTQLALKLHLLCCVYEKEWQLPPLSRDTKRYWFDKAWDYMVNDFRVVPEEDADLSQLAKAAVTRNVNATAKDKREEIKKLTWQSFNGLLAETTPNEK